MTVARYSPHVPNEPKILKTSTANKKLESPRVGEASASHCHCERSVAILSPGVAAGFSLRSVEQEDVFYEAGSISIPALSIGNDWPPFWMG